MIRACRLLMVAGIALPLLVGGCAIPIDHTRSEIQVPLRWQAGNDAEATTNVQWWHQLGGEELQQLLTQARAGNFSLAAAMARMRQADALVRIAGGPLLPQVNVEVGAGRIHAIGDPPASAYSALLVASYELDAWGGKRANRQAMQQQSIAFRYQRDALAISLDAAVAQTYLQVLALRQRALIARQALVNGKQMLAMATSRYQAGAAIGHELAQQEIALAALQQQVERIGQQVSDNMGALATLLGRPVQDIVVTGDALDGLRAPPVDAGIPSELVLRRPDLAALEHTLAAADADVTAARAALLPSFTLTASGGIGHDHWRSLAQHSVFSLVSSITAPIFNVGQLQGQRDQALAHRNEALADYSGAIINSLSEVETALNSVAVTRQQSQHQARMVSQSSEAVRIAKSRYAAGAQTLLELNSVRAALYTQQDAAVSWQLAQLLASVSLYKALGGGWQREGAGIHFSREERQ